jgi:glycosyl transferase family 25
MTSLAMPLYVINLARATERFRHIDAQLKALGLDYELVEAVDGRNLDLASAPIAKPDGSQVLCSSLWERTWQLPGVAACSLSHCEVYRRVMFSRARAAVVLEDDIEVDSCLPQVVSRLRDNLQGAEVVLLNFDNQETVLLREKGAYALGNGYFAYLPQDVGQLHSTAGYVITRDACDAMLANMYPVRAQADEWQFFVDYGGIERMRCVVPLLVRKSAGFTSMICHEQGSFKAWARDTLLGKSPLLRRLTAARRKRILEQWSRWEVVGEAEGVPGGKC